VRIGAFLASVQFFSEFVTLGNNKVSCVNDSTYRFRARFHLPFQEVELGLQLLKSNSVSIQQMAFAFAFSSLGVELGLQLIDSFRLDFEFGFQRLDVTSFSVSLELLLWCSRRLVVFSPTRRGHRFSQRPGTEYPSRFDTSDFKTLANARWTQQPSIIAAWADCFPVVIWNHEVWKSELGAVSSAANMAARRNTVPTNRLTRRRGHRFDSGSPVLFGYVSLATSR
jgi:hypothetical protein